MKLLGKDETIYRYFCSGYIFLFLTFTKVQSSNGLIRNSCSNVRTNEVVEKCELCQRKSGCSPNGVQDRFFACTDYANYGFDCNLEKNTTVLENFVTLNELQENRTCYFDLTNMKNGSEYRSRFYVKKNLPVLIHRSFILKKGLTQKHTKLQFPQNLFQVMIGLNNLSNLERLYNTLLEYFLLTLLN